MPYFDLEVSYMLGIFVTARHLFLFMCRKSDVHVFIIIGLELKDLNFSTAY